VPAEWGMLLMRLYHGTNTLFDGPDLAKCRPYKDFGRGFYLTPDVAVAKRMAERTAERSPLSGSPRYLLVYEYAADRQAELAARVFPPVVDETYARFVMANRLFRANSKDHNRNARYDLVVGPIADDKMGVLFKRFEAGLVSVETLVAELKYRRLSLQYSFHTAKGLSLLKFMGARRV